MKKISNTEAELKKSVYFIVDILKKKLLGLSRIISASI